MHGPLSKDRHGLQGHLECGHVSLRARILERVWIYWSQWYPSHGRWVFWTLICGGSSVLPMCARQCDLSKRPLLGMPFLVVEHMTCWGSCTIVCICWCVYSYLQKRTHHVLSEARSTSSTSTNTGKLVSHLWFSSNKVSLVKSRSYEQYTRFLLEIITTVRNESSL